MGRRRRRDERSADSPAATRDSSATPSASAAAPTTPLAAATHMRLGELLLHQQLVSQQDLSEALLQQDTTGKRLGTLLVELGSLDENELVAILAQQVGLPVVDLSDVEPSQGAIDVLPERVARELHAAPLRVIDEVVHIAVADVLPGTREALENAVGATKAFTLIELLIVIAILAVLTGVGVFVYGSFDESGVQDDIDGANTRTCELAQALVDVNGGSIDDYLGGGLDEATCTALLTP